ncbi:ribonuclease HII [Candidatus Woesearchaeota archaeon]|nr:ribonuclease HII [Candidatus Woesearchaeota archaeon]
MKLVCGIDEAGRGPVIGPLVIAGVAVNKDGLNKLKEIGVKDSKLLPHSKRIELSGKIKEIAESYEILIVEPKEIDDAVDGNNELNLNWLEGIKSAEIINKLNPEKVILDCPSPNTGKYKEFVRKYINNRKIEIIAEHKADVNFSVVSAASILAKVVREDEMDKLKKKYGNIGPGYTSNEITQKFIKENFDKHPEIFRKSWSTFKNAKITKEQKSLSDF